MNPEGSNIVDFGSEVEDYTPPKKLADYFDYKDLWGEYPRILVLRIVATVVLLYVMGANYAYHDPADTLVTEYGEELDPDFAADITTYLTVGTLLGMGFYALSLLERRVKRYAYLGLLGIVALYLLEPLLSGGSSVEVEGRYKTFLGSLFFLFFCGPALFGTYGIWRRKGGHIGISLIILIALGFLYTGDLEQNTTAGLTYGLFFLLYIEIAFASIKYDNYVMQFRPAEQARSVLTDQQRHTITRRLDGLLFKFLFLLAVLLFVTFTLAGAMLKLHEWVARQSMGPISDSVELSSIYGIVFVALCTFALLGVGRMFLSIERE